MTSLSLLAGRTVLVIIYYIYEKSMPHRLQMNNIYYSLSFIFKLLKQSSPKINNTQRFCLEQEMHTVRGETTMVRAHGACLTLNGVSHIC